LVLYFSIGFLINICAKNQPHRQAENYHSKNPTMKKAFLMLLLIVCSVTGYCKKTYTLPLEFFVHQFSDTIAVQSIYCLTEDGKKVWLNNLQNSVLTIEFLSKKKRALKLSSTRIKNNLVKSTYTDLLWGMDKQIEFDLKDIQSIYIEPKFEIESNYFNLDSVRLLLKHKNDSLSKSYENGHHFVVYLMPKAPFKIDTICLTKEVCYDLSFRDKTEILGGVIKNITTDSIEISNSFSETTAIGQKLMYKIYKFAINDIEEIACLKSGGYSRKKIKISEFNTRIISEKRNTHGIPYGFRLDNITGKINFFRAILCESGYQYITEQNGHTVWAFEN
jgi:hypothetical protein